MAEGFTPEPMHYRLTFADETLNGLVVTVRSVSIRRRISFDKVRLTLPKNGAEAEKYIQDIYAEFCDRLVNWNLTDEDGNPVPRTIDGLMDQHDYVAQAIIKAWVDVINGTTTGAGEQADPTMPDFDPSDIPMTSGI